jgi:hypothetical protein
VIIKPLKTGYVLSVVHVVGFLLTVSYTYVSADGQASLVWVYWALIDFPLSLFYFFGESYGDILTTIEGYAPLVAQILYLPNIVHGIFGTIWWLFLPTFISKIFARLKPTRT